MTFNEALSILSRVHTEDDKSVGFAVKIGARPDPWTNHTDYVEAWRKVRMHLGQTVNPETSECD